MTDDTFKTEQVSGQTDAGTKPRLLTDLRDEIDRLWETALANPWRAFRTYSKEPVFPPIDVFEKDGELRIHAELPGTAEQDVEITVEGDVLAITGEKIDETQTQDFYRRERSYGRFARRIDLPDGAQKDQIEARFEGGVLKVRVPVKKTDVRKVVINAD